MKTKFYIPVGGTGERLKPLTNDLPKPLLPVARSLDGSLERIIDKPVSVAQSLTPHIIVAASYKGELIDEHFANLPEVEVVHDSSIVHIGGSMIQHRDQLFHDDPDQVVMIPGDHHLQSQPITRMINALSETDADLIVLGSWHHDYHETYGVNMIGSRYVFAEDEGEITLASLGTYAMRGSWLAQRLQQVPVGDKGHCDLTTDVIFGQDQSRLPHIVFEPLQSGEYWQDVGTIRRLYSHIRYLHPNRDEFGNVNLSPEPINGRALDSVIYFDARDYESGHISSFIANNFVEKCA